MPTLRIFVVFGLLCTSGMAENNALNSSLLPTTPASAVTVATGVPLPDVPLSEKKRPVALALGIALVVAVFHRGLARRQRA
jgi:hypothetical protein